MQLTDHITTKVGDITKECSDAIVNAANATLLGGGGVDGAIHRAGGPDILAQCREIRRMQYPDGLPTGKAVATTAGNMCTKHVIHTVGPIYAECAGECAQLLGNCYRNALELARELGCKSIVFPAISTGIYGYPFEEAATIAYTAITRFVQSAPMEVILIFHSAQSEERFLKAVQ